MSESIWVKLQAIDRRILYWILFIGLMVPFVFPLGLPVPINKNTEDLYAGCTAPYIEEGDIAVVQIGYGVGSWTELMPATVVCTKALLRSGAKVIFCGTAIDIEISIREIQRLASEDFAKSEYGKDYVELGYMTGGETVIAQLARDIRSVFPTDANGTPTDEIEMMENVNSIDDIKVIITADSGETGEFVMKQWVRTPSMVGSVGIGLAGSGKVPYYLAGNLFGLSIGVRGGAELEKMIGELAEATTSMDSINVSHVLVVLAVIMANIGYLATRGKGGK